MIKVKKALREEDPGPGVNKRLNGRIGTDNFAAKFKGQNCSGLILLAKNFQFIYLC